MEAIVLAGGLGTRLRGIVDDVPKPMAPVHGRPFLTLVLDQLVATGFDAAILAAGYRHDAIRSYFGDEYRGLALAYSVESEPLGTGGAIRLACDQAHSRDVFVLNGDTYLDELPRHVRRARGRRGANGASPFAKCATLRDMARFRCPRGSCEAFAKRGNPVQAGSTQGLTYSDPSCAIASPNAARFPSRRGTVAPGSVHPATGVSHFGVVYRYRHSRGLRESATDILATLLELNRTPDIHMARHNLQHRIGSTS